MAQPKNQYHPQGGNAKRTNKLLYDGFMLLLSVAGIIVAQSLYFKPGVNLEGVAVMQALFIGTTILFTSLLIDNLRK